VLLGSRLTSPDGFRAFAASRTSYRARLQADGEDRAWGRRLASASVLRSRSTTRLHHDGDARSGRRTRLRASKGPIPDGVETFFVGLKAHKGDASCLWLGHGRVTRFGQTAQVVQPAAVVRCSSCSSARRWAWTASSTRRWGESRVPTPGLFRRGTAASSPPSYESRARPHRAATRRPRTSRSEPRGSVVLST